MFIPDKFEIIPVSHGLIIVRWVLEVECVFSALKSEKVVWAVARYPLAINVSCSGLPERERIFSRTLSFPGLGRYSYVLFATVSLEIIRTLGKLRSSEQITPCFPEREEMVMPYFFLNIVYVKLSWLDVGRPRFSSSVQKEKSRC